MIAFRVTNTGPAWTNGGERVEGSLLARWEGATVEEFQEIKEWLDERQFTFYTSMGYRPLDQGFGIFLYPHSDHDLIEMKLRWE